jgi:hypothetical protein
MVDLRRDLIRGTDRELLRVVTDDPDPSYLRIAALNRFTGLEWSSGNRTVADNQRALELAQTSYRVGRADLRAVQQQQLNVYAARVALLRVQSEQLAQRVNLHLALGGRFTAAQPPAVVGTNR